jgi:hypothetical protein
VKAAQLQAILWIDQLVAKKPRQERGFYQLRAAF